MGPSKASAGLLIGHLPLQHWPEQLYSCRRSYLQSYLNIPPLAAGFFFFSLHTENLAKGIWCNLIGFLFCLKRDNLRKTNSNQDTAGLTTLHSSCVCLSYWSRGKQNPDTVIMENQCFCLHCQQVWWSRPAYTGLPELVYVGPPGLGYYRQVPSYPVSYGSPWPGSNDSWSPVEKPVDKASRSWPEYGFPQEPAGRRAGGMSSDDFIRHTLMVLGFINDSDSVPRAEPPSESLAPSPVVAKLENMVHSGEMIQIGDRLWISYDARVGIWARMGIYIRPRPELWFCYVFVLVLPLIDSRLCLLNWVSEYSHHAVSTVVHIYVFLALKVHNRLPAAICGLSIVVVLAFLPLFIVIYRFLQCKSRFYIKNCFAILQTEQISVRYRFFMV